MAELSYGTADFLETFKSSSNKFKLNHIAGFISLLLLSVPADCTPNSI